MIVTIEEIIQRRRENRRNLSISSEVVNSRVSASLEVVKLDSHLLCLLRESQGLIRRYIVPVFE